MGDDVRELENLASFWLEEPMPDVLDLLQNSETEPESRVPAKSESDQPHEAQQGRRRGTSRHQCLAEPDDDLDVVRAPLAHVSLVHAVLAVVFGWVQARVMRRSQAFSTTGSSGKLLRRPFVCFQLRL